MIAIINTVLDKSTGKIAEGLNQYLLSRSLDSVFCYGRGNLPADNFHYRIDYPIEVYTHGILSRLLGKQGFYSTVATKRLIKYLENNNVDTLYLLSLHGYYINEKLLFEYIKDRQINMIYVMIDEYPFLGKCGYSGECTNYLNGCGNCPNVREYPCSLFLDRSKAVFSEKANAYQGLQHAVFLGPEYVINKAKDSPLMKEQRLEVLDEAVDVNFYVPRNTQRLCRELCIDEDKIIIMCVACYSQKRKGGKYFMKVADRFVNDERFAFVYVGFDGDEEQCSTNVIPIGYEANQNRLAEYYSLADLFVFPSLQDTMPNVCLETLSCGTPLLCFNTSGMPYIGNEEVMTLVEPGDVDALQQVIEHTGKKGQDTINRCRQYAKDRYDNQKYFAKLLQYRDEMMRKNRVLRNK